MILRSRKILARPPKESNTPRRRAESISTPSRQSTSRGQQRVQLKSPAVHRTPREDAVTPCSKKHALRRARRLQDFLDDEDLRTPHRQRSVRVHFQLDDSSPEEISISSPLVCLYSPPSSGSDGSSPPNHTAIQQNIPDSPYFGNLPEDEAGESFNPYKFICSVQASPSNLRQQKKKIPIKTRSAPGSTLVLDLMLLGELALGVSGVSPDPAYLGAQLQPASGYIQEEVLVESSLLPQPDAEFTFFTPFQDTYYKVYLKLRPHVREFLETLCKIYEIFVFTTAKREYAKTILEILDPQKKLIRHRLYQDHCVCVSGYYVKDLNVLHRDLAKTVALDAMAYTLPFQLTNRIPVQRWMGNQTDRELLTLLPVLEQMTHEDDVRLVISRQFHDELVAS